ncbi:MAG: acyl-CoA thioesterase [Fibrobacteres bacterium CG2_30_45_31]|nr:MAG: acyl-CoA thioesterase [Fibrobacteres bacterium CG2_30_45_31]
MDTKGKPVQFSRIETHDIVHPSDANAYGNVFGGHLVALMDKAACMVAYRHSEAKVVTVSVDGIYFQHPAPVGTMLTLLASLNRAFHSSMEIGIKVIGWRPNEPDVEICKAYMTFVAIDEDSKPMAIPPVIPETEEDKRRYNNAMIRREARLALRDKLVEKGFRSL